MVRVLPWLTQDRWTPDVATVRQRGSGRWQVIPAVAKKAHVFYGPPSRGQTNKVWRDLRAAIDLPEHLTPHSLRHTFASTMLAEGVPLVRVAALCGHTVDVCARTYAHWIGGVDSEAAQVLERSRRAAR